MMNSMKIILSACVVSGLVMGYQQKTSETKTIPERIPNAKMEMGMPNLPDTMAKLSSINRAEIKLGELAKARGQSPEVKQLGEMLIEDHKNAQQKVDEVTQAQKIKLNREVEKKTADEHAATLNRLQELKGAEFDREFLTAMEKGHAEAIQLVKSARSGSADAKVTQMLDEILPVLEKHHARAESLETKPAQRGE